LGNPKILTDRSSFSIILATANSFLKNCWVTGPLIKIQKNLKKTILAQNVPKNPYFSTILQDFFSFLDKKRNLA
jgi:hypothetical protein